MKEKRTSTPNSSKLGDALWLAGRDIRASWLSYPATSLIAGFFGLLGALQFQNALSGEPGAAFGAGVLDFYLLCLVPALGTNLVFNRDYYAAARMDSFDQRLSFLKSLPVDRRTAISGRAVCALVAAAFATPPFFLVPYLLVGALRESVGFGGYVCFCCFWVGYALLMIGILYVYGSFSVVGNYVWMSVYVAGFLGACVLIPVASALVFGGGLTVTVLGLAGTHGVVLAGASLLAGSGAILLSIKRAESGLARRDIG